MLREMLEIKKAKPKFQVLFLRNDSSQEVEVQDVKQVDFLTIQEHLEQGESIFITSKPSQKLNAPKHKGKAPRNMKTRIATAFYLDSA
jgi:hypothetical protein